jgi:hypothetical protein
LVHVQMIGLLLTFIRVNEDLERSPIGTYWLRIQTVTHRYNRNGISHWSR